MKTLGGKVKMLLTSIFSFSHLVFYSIKDKFHHQCQLNLSSATAFYVVQSRIILCGYKVTKI